MSASKVTKSFEILILGRLVFGVFCGLVMSLNPLYILEVSPTSLRGAFAALNQVACATGIFLGMVSVSHPPNGPKLLHERRTVSTFGLAFNQHQELFWAGINLFKRYLVEDHQEGPIKRGLVCLLQVAGQETVLGTERHWALMLSLSLIPALTQYLLLPLCPKSPRYLLLTKAEESKVTAGGSQPGFSCHHISF